jgi:integrase
MPGRKASPPRLYFRDDKGYWIIIDRGRQIGTGCTREETEGAARALETYLSEKHTPTIGSRNPAALLIADVVGAYEETKLPKRYEDLKRQIEMGEPISSDDRRVVRRHDELVIRLSSINIFFGQLKVADIKAELCRDYVDWCSGAKNDRNKKRDLEKRRIISDQTARRHLEDLRAAINVYHGEHTLDVVPKITLPEKKKGRERWLLRSEAARLLGAAIGFVWDMERNAWKRDEAGKMVRRPAWLVARRRPVARFILMGVYSARREETIRRTQWMATTTHPWMDCSRWVYHGRGADESQTKKRRPPAKVATRLRPHLARWQRTDLALAAKLGKPVHFIVHRSDGAQYAEKIKTGWDGIVEDAGLGADVVRHILRHTAATWLMQKGTDPWQAAGWLGMTLDQLQENYGHHHPDFQEEAAEAFSGRRS